MSVGVSNRSKQSEAPTLAVDRILLESNGNYVSSSGKPRTFYLEGMDLPGSTPYALPHEQVFSDHIIEVGPLAGNMI